MQVMNIGEAAKNSGISSKMIRHYEEVGLLPAPPRTESGYRQYTPTDVHTLRFIRQARDLGFSIPQISQLVGLWQNRRRPSRSVKTLAEAHIKALEEKSRELMAMKASLEHLVHCCNGDDRPECPILDTLSGSAEEASAVRAKPARLIAGRQRSGG